MEDQYWRLPDGRTAFVPASYTDRQRDQIRLNIARAFPDDIEAQRWLDSKRTLIGGVDIGAPLEAILDIPRGALRTGVSAVQGAVGLVTPGNDTRAEQYLRGLQEGLSPNPVYADNPLVKAGGAIGSTVPFLGAGLGARALAATAPAAAALPAGFAALTGVSRQSGAIQRQRDAGNEVDNRTEVLANLGGSLVGLTEVLPIGGILSRMPGVRQARDAATRSLVRRALGEGARDTAALMAGVPARAWRSAQSMPLMTEAVRSFVGEGAQEATAGVMQNFIEQGLYNDSLRIGDSLLEEFLLGGIAGGTVSVAANALMNSPTSRAAALQVEQRARDAQVRTHRTAMEILGTGESLVSRMGSAMVPDVAEPYLLRDPISGKTVTEMAEEGLLAEVATRNFGVAAVPDAVTGIPSTFTVVDNRTGEQVRGLPVFRNPEEARAAVSDLQDEQVALAEFVNNTMSLYQTGQENNPLAQSLLRLTRGVDKTTRIPRSQMPLIFGRDGETPADFWARMAQENTDISSAVDMSVGDVIDNATPEQARSFLGTLAYRSRERFDASVGMDTADPDQLSFEGVDGDPETQMLPGRGVLPQTFVNPDGSDAAVERGASLLRDAARRAMRRVGINATLGERNGRIIDDGLRSLAETVTGSQSFTNMSNSQKVLLINTIESMPVSRMRIDIPTPESYVEIAPLKRAIELVEDNPSGYFSPNDLIRSSGLPLDFSFQKLRDVITARTGKTIKVRGNKVLVTEPKATPSSQVNPEYDVSADDRAIIRAYNEMDSDTFVDFMTEVIAGDLSRARTPEVVEEGALPSEVVEESKGEARERAMLVQRAIDRGVQYHEMMLNERNKMSLQGVGLGAPSNSGQLASSNAGGAAEQIAESMAEFANTMYALQTMDPSAQVESAPLGYYDSIGNRIAINLTAVDPTNEMGAEELFDKTAALRAHEYLHALVEKNYLYDAEIDTLIEAASNQVVPASVDADANSKGYTFLERAQNSLDPEVGYNDARIAIEAAADLWGAVATGHVPESGIGLRNRKASNVVSNLLKRSIGLLKDSDIRRVGALVDAWKSGRIGRRGAGASVSSVVQDESGARYSPGEMRAPRNLANIYLNEAEAAQVIQSLDRRASEITRAFANATREPSAETEVQAPPAIDPEQYALFDALASSGHMAVLEDARVPHAVDYTTIADREGNPTEAMVMYLPGETSNNLLEGIAKTFGDAMSTTPRLRVMAPEGNVRDNSFGVTFKVPQGTDANQIASALEKLDNDGYTVYPEVIGGELAILDPLSSSPSYTDADALRFMDVVKDALYEVENGIKVDYVAGGGRVISSPVGNALVYRMPGRAARWIVSRQSGSALPVPSGEFSSAQEAVDATVNELKQEVADRPGLELGGFFVDDRVFDNVEGGFDQMESGINEQNLERNRSKAGASENARSFQSPDLRGLTIHRLYDRAAAVREAVTGEPAIRGYDVPGNAIGDVGVEERQASEIKSNEEEVANNTQAPLFGDNVPPSAIVEAATALRDGYDPAISGFNVIKTFNKDHFFEPVEGMERLRRTNYSRNVEDTLSTWETALEILDSPAPGAALSERLEPLARNLTYQIADRMLAVDELSRRVNDQRVAEGKEPFTAVNSAIAAARVGLERSSALARFALSGSPGAFAVYEGDDANSGGYGSSAKTITDSQGDTYSGLVELFDLLHQGARIIVQVADEVMLKMQENSDIQIANNAEALLNSNISDTDREYLLGRYEAVVAGDRGLKTREQRDNRIAENEKYIADVKSTLTDGEVERLDRFTSGYRDYMNTILESTVDAGLLKRDSIAHVMQRDVAYYVPLVEDYRERLGADDDLAGFEELLERVRSIEAGKPSSDTGRTVLERTRTYLDSRVETPLFARSSAYTMSAFRNIASNVAKSRVVRDLRSLGELIDPADADPAKLLAAQGMNKITVREDGDKKTYVLEDPKMATALLGIHSSGWSNPFTRIMRRMSRMARDLITATPDFILRQMVRDPVSVEMTTGASGGFGKSFQNYFATLMEEASDDTMMQAVVGGWALPADYSVTDTDAVSIEDQMRRIANLNSETASGRAWQQMKRLSGYDWLSGMSRKTEFAARKAVYDKALAETGDTYEANMQALEVINFGRRGANNALHFLASVTPFLNAGIQGTSVFLRSATGSYRMNDMDMMQARRAFMARGMVMSAFTTLYWAMNQLVDDEEYEGMRDRERENYYSFPLPGRVRLRMPIAFESGTMFKVIPEALLNAAAGDATLQDTAATLGRGLGVFTQRDQIAFVPWVVRPLSEAFATGKDGYTGGDVVPKYLRTNRLPSDQYSTRTNRAVVEGTQALNALLPSSAELSPMQVEHVINGYLPGLMTYLFAAADAATRFAQGQTSVGAALDPGDPLTFPAIRALMRESGGGNQEDLYAIIERANQIYGSVVRAQDEGDLETLDQFFSRPSYRTYLDVREEVNAINERLGDLRRARDAVMNSLEYTSEQKRQIFEQQKEERDRILERIPEIKEYLSGE